MKKIILTLAILLLAYSINAQEWTTMGEAGFSEDVLQYGGRKSATLAINSAGEVYVAYICDNENPLLVRIKKFDGQDWILVGNPINYNDNAYGYNVNIEIDPDDNIYVGFWGLDTDKSILENIKRQLVYMFNGASWDELGNFQLTDGIPSASDSFIDGDGYYCVHYYQDDYGYVVKRYTGSGWEIVGNTSMNPTMPTAQIGQPCYALDNDGNIWVSYFDGENGLGLSVNKFDGTSWTKHSTWISSEEASATSIIIADNNTPYVAHVEYAYATPQLFKYTGTDWVLEHTNGYNGEVETALAKDSYGNIFHVCGGLVSKLPVSSGNWEILAGSIPGGYDYIDMVGDNFGNIFACFKDVNNSGKLTVYKHTENKTVTFNIAEGLEPEIELAGHGTQTATGGTTVFENIPVTPYPGIAYTAELMGYETITGNVMVDGDEVVDLTLVITGIIDAEKKPYDIYPNPSNGIINLTGFRRAGAALLCLEIADITGKTIYTREGAPMNVLPDAPIQIDLTNKPKGIYFLTIKTETGVYTEKLIIQ